MRFKWTTTKKPLVVQAERGPSWPHLDAIKPRRVGKISGRQWLPASTANSSSIMAASRQSNWLWSEVYNQANADTEASQSQLICVVGVEKRVHIGTGHQIE